MMNFQVGQQVVCVDDSGLVRNAGHFTYPIRGRIYTIRELLAHVDGRPCVRLVEIMNPVGAHEDVDIYCEPYFDCLRFRPLVTRSTDISFAHEILRRASAEAEVEA